MAKELRVHIGMVIMLCVFSSILEALKPLAMKQFLDFTEPEAEKTHGNLLKCIGVFVLTSYVETLVSSYRHARNNQLHLNMHQKLKIMLFKKFIKLSSSSKKHLETGALLNQYHSDSGSLGSLLHRSIFVFFDAFKLFTSWWYLNQEIGGISYILPLIITFCIVMKTKVENQVKKFRKKTEGISEKISKITNEYVSGIRVLKYYGWEDVAIKKIS